MKAMVVQIIRCTVHVYLDTRSWYSYGGIGGEKVKALYSIKEMWTYNNIDSPPFMTNARRIWGTELGWIASRGVYVCSRWRTDFIRFLDSYHIIDGCHCIFLIGLT